MDVSNKDHKIDLLDHGFVRLVDHMGSDLSIVRSARVSYNAEWRTGEDAGKDEKLLAYLIHNRHTSPLEAVKFTFEVKCPIFVSRQWMRHRTWAYNEVSARYSEPPEEFYVPQPEMIGKQSKSNKQMRDLTPLTDSEYVKADELCAAIKDTCSHAFAVYRGLLNDGVPRELARGVLPVNTYTHFFATVDLHNLMHWLRLRLHSHAQHEIQVYGKAILDLIEPVVPVTIRLFKETLDGT
jgi:thymidylate synthase (FAD)